MADANADILDVAPASHPPPGPLDDQPAIGERSTDSSAVAVTSDLEGSDEHDEDGEPKGATTEEKLKRERAARKRAERKARDANELRDQIAALTHTVTQLAQRQGASEGSQLAQAEQQLTAQLEHARQAKRQAREAGDIDAEERADEALYQIRKRQEQVEAIKRQPRRPERSAQDRAQGPQPVSDLAADWAAERSEWFNRDAAATAVAMRESDRISRELRIPPNDPQHFQKLDESMARRFPEYYEDEPPRTQQQRQRPGQTVAGTPRGGGSPGQHRTNLTPGQERALARAGHNTSDPKWREEYGAAFATAGRAR